MSHYQREHLLAITSALALPSLSVPVRPDGGTEWQHKQRPSPVAAAAENNADTITFMSHICAVPTVTYQNVCGEKKGASGRMR